MMHNHCTITIITISVYNYIPGEGALCLEGELVLLLGLRPKVGVAGI